MEDEKWTTIEEGLPKNEQAVLFSVLCKAKNITLTLPSGEVVRCYEGVNFRVTCMGFFYENNGCFSSLYCPLEDNDDFYIGDDDKKVIAWAPLPSPYKGS